MMRDNPFLITGPAVVSFSGGRTSAYMLRCIVQAHGGTLPPDVLVCFANTGREMEATLRFVRDCAGAWDVPVHWLEYRRGDDGKPRTDVVAYQNASRAGEPFEQLLRGMAMLPNPALRYCTTELKIRTIKRWAMARGWKRWVNVVGLRADEPRRVERAIAPKPERWTVVCPLAVAGVTKADVNAFWAAQPFDLRLRGDWEGNCDGCFLKRTAAIGRMARDYPERMAWWGRMEAQMQAGGKARGAAAKFRRDRPGYMEIATLGFPQARLHLDPDDDGWDVFAACDAGCGA